MESVGRELRSIMAACMGRLFGRFTSWDLHLPAGQKFADDFHTFAIEWERPRFVSTSTTSLPDEDTGDASGKRWVFDHPFFVILNVAVGGSFPGNPDKHDDLSTDDDR